MKIKLTRGQFRKLMAEEYERGRLDGIAVLLPSAPSEDSAISSETTKDKEPE